MPEASSLIRLVDGTPRQVEDDWRWVPEGAQWDGAPGAIVPLAFALEHPDRLRSAGRVGVWLAPDEDPARAVPLFGIVALIGVQFPKFTDGRGYSIAVLLRTRHGWKGELRALGEVLQDQLHMMRRVGFDSFALAPHRDVQAALRAFAPFSDAYQGSVEPRLPAFARASSRA
jgi:uncharacterized protein (DUF934 family)